MNFVLLQFLYLYCVTFQLWSIFASETEFCRSTNSFEYLVRCVHAGSWHRGLARGRYVESFGSGVHTCELQRGINYDISEHLIYNQLLSARRLRSRRNVHKRSNPFGSKVSRDVSDRHLSCKSRYDLSEERPSVRSAKLLFAGTAYGKRK